MEKAGNLAAFGTAVFWTLSALVFEKASKKSGVLAVNFYKVLIAFFLLSAASWIFLGQPFPTDASVHAWLYLSISGFVGFVIADYFLFSAYILIGSRVTVIFQALTPLFTAFLAFVILGERMRPESLFGMGFVIAGILLVVLARQKAKIPDTSSGTGKAEAGNARVPGMGVAGSAENKSNQSDNAVKGYVFAFFSTVFQATGLVFSKIGLGSYNAISGTQIRILTAIAGFALQAIVLRQTGIAIRRPLKDKTAMATILAGAVFGPFLGVTLSLVALQNTNAGAASTLMALTPVLIIPPSIIFLNQKVSKMEAAGAMLAVTGAALFFLI